MDDRLLNDLINNPNQLQKLVSQLMLNKRISWSTYDRKNIENTIKQNSYVFSAISKIAKASTNLNLLVGKYDSKGVFTEDKNNGLYKLLQRPNPVTDIKAFIEAVIFWYYPFGECFVYADRYTAGANAGQVFSNGLWLAPPQLTEITANGLIPTGYVINTNTSKEIPFGNMLHLKAFNPDYEDMHGLPYLAVAGKLVDKLDSIDEMEVKAFQNSGPAYLLSPKENSSLTKPEYENIIDWFRKIWKNPKTKGGIAGTSALVDLKEIGKSPVDLGTIESQKHTLRMLCSVWGLDPGLFDVEASTYNNKQEINKSIYTEAAIPFMTRFASGLTHWLGEAYGGVEVIIDTSNVEVLQPNLEKKVQWMVSANVFSDNEIREATGYEAIESPIANLIPSEKMDIEAIQGFEPKNLDKDVI